MKNNSILKTKTLVVISFLGAISSILMYFDFPLPIAPSFMKMDLSELPVIIGGFILGPVASFIIAIIKILLKLFLKGTSTMFLGELANFIGCIAYALPASIIYSVFKTKKRAIIGLITGTIFSSIVCTAFNATILFPLYINVFNMSEEVIINMCQTINSHIDSMFKVMLFSVFPFNIIKYFLTSFITYIFYKHISKIIKKIVNG